MSKGPATIRDVAKAAKVSAATVSRHLNKSIVLPPETARRIEKACALLAYRPNALAKRLSLGSSQIIGLLAPEIANPFFASLAAAAEAEARRQGYSLLIMSTGGDADIECEHIDRLRSRDVDPQAEMQKPVHHEEDPWALRRRGTRTRTGLAAIARP